MAKSPRPVSPERLVELRQRSGWWLAAWRTKVGLTIEELAAEVKTTRGMVSDLETGAPNSKTGLPKRYNRDWVERFSQALGVPGGWLIDVNPYVETAASADIVRLLPQLADYQLDDIRSLVERYASRKAS